jgi:hypothetical protein
MKAEEKFYNLLAKQNAHQAYRRCVTIKPLQLGKWDFVVI